MSLGRAILVFLAASLTGHLIADSGTPLLLTLVFFVALLTHLLVIEDFSRYRKYYRFFQRPGKLAQLLRSKIFKGLREKGNRSNLAIFSIFLLVFIFHFWLQWSFDRRAVMSGVVHIVMDPFYFLLHNNLLEAFQYRHFQINSYTGNPFFLLPVLLIVGYSPLGLRLTFIGVFSLSMALFFLAYQRKFDLKKAILGILILTSMMEWVFHRFGDYDYTIMFFSILLYIFVLWEESGAQPDSNYIYLASFLGGLLFYFKATTAYMLLSLSAAAVYLNRKQPLSFLRNLNLPALTILFLIGVSPFFVYNYYHFDVMVGDGYSLSGPDNLSLEDLPVRRFQQIDSWTGSEVKRLSAHAPLSFLSVFEKDGFRGLSMISVLFLISIIYLLLSRSHLPLVIIFSVFYTMLFFVPMQSGIWRYQTTVLVPMIPMIIIAALDKIPERLEKSTIYKITFAVLCLAFAFGTLSYVSTLEGPESPEEWNVNYWAGDQSYYNDFKSLGISGQVVTNSYKAYAITKYFIDVSVTDFLLPRKTTKTYLKKTNEGPARKVAFTSHYSVPLDRWGLGSHGPLEVREPVNLVLRENLPCTPRKEFCGASISQVLNEFNLTKEDMEEVTLDNETYLVAKDVVLTTDS